MDLIMQLKGIDKRFGAVHALRDIDLDIYQGETLALVGENGAGKSTLVKALTGAHGCDSGEIVFCGKPVKINGPSHAKTLGISQAYQRAEYIPELTVGENILLGEEGYTRRGFVRWNEIYRVTQQLLDQYGITIDAHMKMRDLSVAECQLVTIAKMLRRKPKLIIFDEPTAVLSDNEVNILFRIIHQLQEDQVTMIYISHRLDEVFRLAHRIAVMRDGAMVTVLKNENVTQEMLVEHMLGRRLETMFPEKLESASDEEVLRVEGLTNENIRNVSFSLRRGEVLAIIGLVGSKRTELVRAIYGVDRLQKGKVWIEGKEEAIHSPLEAVNKGLFLAPEDRKGAGVVAERSVKENITYSNLAQFFRHGFVKVKEENRYAENMKRQMSIRAPSPQTLCCELSGGNQQKVVVAKALTAKPKILIIDEPTQGIDVGAKAEIYALVNVLIQRGVSVLMITSETDEALGLANRVLVMREGAIAGELSGDEMNAKNIMSLMYRSVERGK